MSEVEVPKVAASEVPLFVPVVLGEGEAIALANAGAFVLTKLATAGLGGPDHPVFSGALKVQDALDAARVRRAEKIAAEAAVAKGKAS